MRLPVLAPTLAALVLATTAHAEVTLPERQPGQWELIMADAEGKRQMTMLQCTDAATDKMFMGMAMGFKDMCKRYDLTEDGGTYVIESDCTIGGMHAVGRTVVEGDFQSAYKMVLYSTTKGTTVPKDPTMTITATRLGDCAADQKPGDIVMPGGQKMNVLQMGKNAGG